MEKMWNGTCNVMAWDKSELVAIESSEKNRDRKFIIGDKLLVNEPHAIVSRRYDPEFSDTVNWMVNALFYGDEQGLTKDLTRCPNSTTATNKPVEDLDFLNAVYCVGNYGDIFDGDEDNRGRNRINDGSTGMIYGYPLGNLERDDDLDSAWEGYLDTTRLDQIRDAGSLNCGVVNTTSISLVDMSTDFCHTLAAGFFNGNSKAANITYYSGNDDSSFIALGDHQIDVLSGAMIEKKYDFAKPSRTEWAHFSTPYYYGNETGG